jgi:hypothetical protein
MFQHSSYYSIKISTYIQHLDYQELLYIFSLIIHRIKIELFSFFGSSRILMEKKFHFTAPSDFHI